MSHSRRRIKKLPKVIDDKEEKINPSDVVKKLDNLTSNVKRDHQKLSVSKRSNSNKGFAALGLIIVFSTVLIIGYQFIVNDQTPEYNPPAGIVSSIGGFYFDRDAPLLVFDGKISVIYIGAEFCPYCATQKWPVYFALSQLGTFSGLGETSSPAESGLPPIPTVSFIDSSYSSSEIEFQSVETGDKEGNPLQTMNSVQENLFNKYNDRNSIPFLIIGGAYFKVGTGVSPSFYDGLTFSEINNALNTKTGSVYDAINAESLNILLIINEIQSTLTTTQTSNGN